MNGNDVLKRKNKNLIETIIIDNKNKSDLAHFQNPKNSIINDSIKSLKKQINRLNDIILKSDTVLFVWTLEENVPAKYVSDNVIRYGYRPKDFYSGKLQDYWQFIFEEDREEAKKRVYEARLNKQSEMKHQYRVICSSGEIKWVEEWMCIETDLEGNVIEEKGFVRDITESMVMHKKVVESERRFRRMYENTSMLIFSCDPKGVIIEVNRAMADFLGCDKFFFNGKNMSNYLESKAKKELEDLLSMKEKNETHLHEWNYIDKKNDMKLLKLNSAREYNSFGNLVEIQFYAEDITEKKIKDSKIKYLSEHDGLTKLYNRRVFDVELKKAYEEKKFPLAVVIGDINGLKLVNDAFGHEMGDRYLVHVADLIKKNIRTSDIPVRLGGDEFAIILPNADEEIANRFINRLRKAFSENKFDYIKPSVAMSYAIKNDDDLSMSELYRIADEKMYKNKLNNGKSVRSSIIASLLTTLDEKTYETKLHGDRIKILAIEMAKILGFNRNMCDELELAALMHDIGKIAIPVETLAKKGKLNNFEWDEIKRHPETGYHILLASPNLASIGEIVLCHHERWDGKGYPRGLKEDKIPFLSRIISICDAFDVMTHDRPYKKAISFQNAIEEMKNCFGTQFDPNLEKVFLEAAKNIFK